MVLVLGISLGRNDFAVVNAELKRLRDESPSTAVAVARFELGLSVDSRSLFRLEDFRLGSISCFPEEFSVGGRDLRGCWR
jgi:hypothetical protein